MKILHVVSSLNPKSGGVSQALNTLINELNIFNFKSEVVTTDCLSAAFLKNCNFKIYALGPTKTAWHFTLKLKNWLTIHIMDYDRIIIHGLWQYQSLAVYQSFKKINGKKPKLFVMPHGMLDPYFQKGKARRFKAIRNSIIWHLIESRLINISDGLLFTCEEEKILAKETFTNYQPQNEIVIGLGIDLPPIFEPSMTKAFNAKIGGPLKTYWLFISRIHEKKGVDLLITAYQNLKLSGFVAIPKLVIAGPGLETEYGKTVLDLASSDIDIHFPGMLQGDAKWGALYGAELFVLPSHQENFGIAIVEAMACKTPVLITNKVNIWREIESGKGGLVVADNVTSVLASMKQWVSLSISDKETMGCNAYETYYSNFTAEAASKKFVEVIKRH